MSSSYSNTNQNINPKPCVYNCEVQIFWNATTSEYCEVFTKKKHICPNRVNNKPVIPILLIQQEPLVILNRTYYSKKPWSTQPKPKMSNSFELLTGSIDAIQKKYEILSDVVSEYNGKVHGSQRDRDPKTGLLDLLVYYEVLEGKRDEVKRKLSMLISLIISQTG